MPLVTTYNIKIFNHFFKRTKNSLPHTPFFIFACFFDKCKRLFCTETLVLWISDIEIHARLRFGWADSINTHLRLEILPHHIKYCCLGYKGPLLLGYG